MAIIDEQLRIIGAPDPPFQTLIQSFRSHCLAVFFLMFRFGHSVEI